MTALTFTWRDSQLFPVDLAPLTPENLARATIAEIGGMLLHSGKRKIAVRDLFTVSGSDASSVVIESGAARLDRIGQGMASGSIVVHGDAGAYLGLGMKGGQITVTGSAGAFAACEMRKGAIRIQGNAGDFLGAALPGDRLGMRGGVVIVEGHAGDRVADQMRRGYILIRGNVGDYCAARMRAGTVIVLGKCGAAPGFGMRRGTLLLKEQPRLPATFNDCGVHSMLFLRLLQKALVKDDAAWADFVPGVRVRRYAGDLAEGGKGEILVYV